MFLAQIDFSTPSDRATEKVEQVLQAVIIAWSNNGQILDYRELYLCPDGTYRIWVELPEKNSLDLANGNQSCAKALSECASMGIAAPLIEVKGIAVEGDVVCDCKSCKALILITNFASDSSPLRCMSCYGQVPLYRFPRLKQDDLRGWKDNYKACDTLWLGSQVGEFFALREMSVLDSELTQLGRSLCKQIEAEVDLPTYFYLYRWGDRRRYSLDKQNLIRERARSCPSCKDHWLLPEPIEGFLDFRCDPCRLVSNMAFSY